MLVKTSETVEEVSEKIFELEKAIEEVPFETGVYEIAKYSRDVIIPIMDGLRDSADKLETFIPHDLLPYPTYTELMFSVK